MNPDDFIPMPEDLEEIFVEPPLEATLEELLSQLVDDLL